MPFLTASPDYVLQPICRLRQDAPCGIRPWPRNELGTTIRHARRRRSSGAVTHCNPHCDFSPPPRHSVSWCTPNVGSQREWVGVYCYVLAVCFLMLFNPRTENNSYSALAPSHRHLLLPGRASPTKVRTRRNLCPPVDRDSLHVLRLPPHHRPRAHHLALTSHGRRLHRDRCCQIVSLARSARRCSAIGLRSAAGNPSAADSLPKTVCVFLPAT